MVVSRRDMFSLGIWHGLKTDDIKKYINLISRKHKFLPRSQVEEDARWQQIIPYLVFENENKIFLMRRKANHTDLRLADKYSIGVGGHVNKKDMGSHNVMDWARREFEEEIDYKGKYKTEFLGLINDDSNDVGLVHLGLVIKVWGDSDNISVKDEHKSGEMITIGDAGKYYKRMETWSQIVYDFLLEKRQGRQMSPSTKLRTSQNSQAVQKLPSYAGKLRKGDDSIIGILPDWAIADHIKQGKIKIVPLVKDWRKNIDQVSIDFHLGTHIKLFRAGTYRFVDTRRGLPEDAMEEVNLVDGDPFILEPGAFAIATTREILTLPPDVIGRLEGRSSLARLGILVHSTAARFDPGWNGAPVLELGNLGPKPAILYCGMAICAFTFEKLMAKVSMPYAGSRSDRYSGSRQAIASKIEHYAKMNQKSGKRTK